MQMCILIGRVPLPRRFLCDEYRPIAQFLLSLAGIPSTYYYLSVIPSTEIVLTFLIDGYIRLAYSISMQNVNYSNKLIQLL